MTTSAKFALLGAIGLAAMTLAGCGSLSSYTEISSGSSTSGIDAYRKGDYKTAAQIFGQQHADHPDDLYALLNYADASAASGEWQKSVTLFQQLAATGKSSKPQYFSEKISMSSPTFTDLACYHLKQLQAKDPNCA